MKASELRPGDRLTLKGSPWTITGVDDLPGRAEVTVVMVDGKGREYGRAVARSFDFPDPDRDTADGVANVIEMMPGTRELYRQHADGSFTAALVDEQSIAGHLLTWHGVTWEGVSLAEARLVGSTVKGLSKTGRRTAASFDDPVAERTSTPEVALAAADFAGMMKLHDSLHASAANMPTRHVHADLVPPAATRTP